MTAIGIVLVGIGGLLVFSAFEDHPGSVHQGGPIANLARAFRGGGGGGRTGPSNDNPASRAPATGPLGPVGPVGPQGPVVVRPY